MDSPHTSPAYIALIPAYKPLDLLPDLVRDLTRVGFSVVVVDDGSGAAFEPIFRRCAEHAEICTHPENAGKGRALKTGLAYIRDTYGESPIVVTVDADGQHAVKDALAVCRMAEQNPHTLVFGSRKFTGKVPFRSRLGNSITQIAYHIFSGVRMCDTQTGLRAFSGDLIPRLLDTAGERYDYEMTMLFEFTKQGIPILEHEIATIYENNNASSHFKPIRDSLRLYRQIFRASAYTFLSFAVDLTLFAVLFWITGLPIASNVASRGVSATLRFILNRKFGFRRRGELVHSILLYTAMTVGILAINTACLWPLMKFCGVPAIAAKLIASFVCCGVSFLAKKIAVQSRTRQWVSRIPRPIRSGAACLVYTLALCGLSLCVLVLTVSGCMVDAMNDRVTSVSATPNLTGYDCILVLGAGVREDGTASPMLSDRVSVACDLYTAGDTAGVPLLMSGDHTGDYNEVAVMKTLAIEAGVPSEDIFLDHEGYSTYESLRRAKEVFGAKKVVIVSQGYHLYRALFIARELGLEAIGCPADLRDYYLQTRYELREKLARFKDFFVAIREDALPAYTGEPIDLTGDGSLT